MADTSSSGWKSALRTAAFAALAAAILLALAAGFFLPAADGDDRQRAELYRRGGDTFVRMFYLARAGGWEEGGRQFLGIGGYHYQLSVAADPSDVGTAVSFALVLTAVGEEQEGSRLLTALSSREPPGPRGNQLIATLAVAYSTKPREEYVEMAAEFLRGLVPGRMILADAYERMGRPDLADLEWRSAEEEAYSLLRRIKAMLAVCGTILGAGAVGLVLAIVRRFWRSEATLAPAAGAAAGAGFGVREAVEALILWLFVAMIAGAVLIAVMPAEAPHEAVYQLLVALVAGVPAIAWVLLNSPSGTRLGWRLAGWWRQVAAGISAAGLAAAPVLVLHQLLQDLQVRQMFLRPRGLTENL
ncbi:MAG: hypothetical protein JSV79_11500, partial [Armatimonadota bacterium]